MVAATETLGASGTSGVRLVPGTRCPANQRGAALLQRPTLEVYCERSSTPLMGVFSIYGRASIGPAHSDVCSTRRRDISLAKYTHAQAPHVGCTEAVEQSTLTNVPLHDRVDADEVTDGRIPATRTLDAVRRCAGRSARPRFDIRLREQWRLVEQFSQSYARFAGRSAQAVLRFIFETALSRYGSRSN